MSVRPLTPEDVAEVIALGYKMHQESVYRHFDYDENKCGQLLYRFLTNPNTCFAHVAESDGELVGVFLGSIGEHYFGRDLVASDTLWYVLPEHRGSRAGGVLLKTFESWAKDRNAAEINVGISSGLSAEKTGAMLQKVGYEVVGGIYKRRVVE